MKSDRLRMNSISESLVDLSSAGLVWPKPSIPPPLPADSTLTDYLPLILNARVYDVSIETPLQFARKLSARYGSTIYLKREDMQPIYSFKCRGSFNKMYNLTKEQKGKGVCCVSAGNHAQGVAMAAQKLGIRATIVMPLFAPEIKVENVRRLGANVILFGNDFDEAKKECLRICELEKLTLVPPFDDPLIIAGQGTCGMEILNQIRQTRLDAVFVCCGGGGLLAGIAAFIKRVRPEVKVIGVNTITSDSMFQSLHAGQPVLLEKVGLFSDGTSVKLVGSECVKICRHYVDDMIKVNNDEICAAIKDGYEDTRGIIEPAGALGLAGLKKYLIENPGLRGGVFAAVTSGANMNFDRLRFVAERASVGEGREALLSVLIPESIGTMKKLYDAIYPRSVTELSYRYSDVNEAHVFLGFYTANVADIQKVIQNINSQDGFKALDITRNEMASQHVRYMSGGRSSTVSSEWLVRLRLPERPGALCDFFELLESGWSFTLFHYRNHGADYARILVGINIPNQTAEITSAFIAKMEAAGIKEIVDESSNPVYSHFMIKFKRSGKFDELRRYLLEEFSQSPQGQQLHTSLTRLASETEATSKTGLMAALGKSNLFNTSHGSGHGSRNDKNGIIGRDLIGSRAFKDRVRGQLKDSLSDLKQGKKGEVPNISSNLLEGQEMKETNEGLNNVKVSNIKQKEGLPNKDADMDVDMDVNDEAESIDLQIQARDILNENRKDITSVDKDSKEKDLLVNTEAVDVPENEMNAEISGIATIESSPKTENSIQYLVGQKVAALINSRYFLCEIKGISENVDNKTFKKTYNLRDVSQRIDCEKDKSIYEFNSSTLIDVINEHLFDQIQVGDKALALYRENDDVDPICSEFYPCAVIGMAQNGLFVRYEDGEKQIVKIGEIIKKI